jgi:hypothetical protein
MTAAKDQPAKAGRLLSIRQVSSHINRELRPYCTCTDHKRLFFPSTIRRMIARGEFPPPCVANLPGPQRPIGKLDEPVPVEHEAFWSDEVERWIDARRERESRYQAREAVAQATATEQ